MPIIKIQYSLSGSNKGSSKNAINYLCKEQKFKDKSLRKEENFFNQKGFSFSKAAAIKKLDSKRQGLRSTDSKFYSLTISPSEKELASLSDHDLKEYTKDFMKVYADNFNKNIDPEDLVWFAKLEHTRKYKGYRNGKTEKLPAGKKSGDFKPGDNRHIHILVRKKTEKNVSISPMANARYSNKYFGKGTQVGFNRVHFIQRTEALMHRKIKSINSEFKITEKDLFAGRYLKANNNDYDRAIEIGLSVKYVNQIKSFNRPSKAELTKEIRAEIFNIHQSILKTASGQLEDYIDRMKNKNVTIYPVFKNQKTIGLKIKYKGQNFKSSEVHRSMSFLNISKNLKENAGYQFENKEVTKINFKSEININSEKNKDKDYQSVLSETIDNLISKGLIPAPSDDGEVNLIIHRKPNKKKKKKRGRSL